MSLHISILHLVLNVNWFASFPSHNYVMVNAANMSAIAAINDEQ